MAVSKQSQRRSGSRRRQNGDLPQGDLLRVLGRVCDQLQRVAATIERIGGLIESHLQASVVQTKQDAPTARPTTSLRDELPGQQLLPLQPVPPTSAADKSKPVDAGRPWSFDRLAQAAHDLVQRDADREWDGASLCKALKDSGARLASWRGMPVKLTAHLKKKGTIKLLEGARFRAAPARQQLREADHDRSRDDQTRRADASARSPARFGQGRSDVGPWPMARVFEIASEIVLREPDREWSGPDICQALLQAGARLESWRGVPMQITAELKRRGVIQAVSRASFRVVGAAPAPDRAVDAAGLKQASKRPSPSTPAIPWDEIVAAARRCLEAEPCREWTWPELARAARDTGVASPTWKGIHIGLVAKLEALGLVERVDAQRVRAVVSFASSPLATPDVPVIVAHSPVAGSEGAATEEISRSERPTPEADSTPATTASALSSADSVFALADEIEKLGPWLSGLSQRQRTAQVAAWAGRVRRLQESVGNLQPDEQRRVRDALRPMLGGLARMAKKYGCDWVDALSSEWEAEDWDGYIEYNHAVARGHAPAVEREQEESCHRDRLRGLFNPHRKTARRDAPDTIREALTILPETDATVARAIRMFGRPPERRADPPTPAPPFRRRDDARARPDERVAIVREVPADVLAITRGKHALVAGGQGAREAHRTAIQKSLQLERLEWVYGERGNGSHFATLESRMRPGRYDLVLLLASHSGHNSNGLVDACRNAGIPLVYLARGYSVTSVIEAIRQQVLARRVPEWMEK